MTASNILFSKDIFSALALFAWKEPLNFLLLAVFLLMWIAWEEESMPVTLNPLFAIRKDMQPHPPRPTSKTSPIFNPEALKNNLLSSKSFMTVSLSSQKNFSFLTGPYALPNCSSLFIARLSYIEKYFYRLFCGPDFQYTNSLNGNSLVSGN